MGRLLQTALQCLTVAGLCYYIYFLLAPWIWSQNIPFNRDNITPWVLDWTLEHDGVEIYALYILMFVNCGLAVALTMVADHIAENKRRIVLGVICAAASASYCASIGFTPPMNFIESTTLAATIRYSLLIAAVVALLLVVMYLLQRRSLRVTVAVVALVLVPVCFIATETLSWMDYCYVFAPALRLLKGAPLNDIYFQYDLLPSLLAAGWMKCGLDLNAFQILGQASFYAVILGVFLFSLKLFQRKELSLFLVVALVLGRIYASPWDVVLCFQVTPLRLDLWLPLLLVVFYFGPYHWLAGAVCGLLILLLKNFGIIYSLAYLQLLITLFAIAYCDGGRGKPLPGQLFDFFKRSFPSLALIAVSGVVSHFLFKNDQFGSYAGYYQKIGIGFIQIATNSFYWYIPPVFSLTILLLIKLRSRLPAAYLATGLLLVLCAIGNSIYFFGRSHEHNILNIAVVLLFVLFMLFDLVTRYLSLGDDGAGIRSRFRHHAVNCIAGIVIVVIIVSYASNIARKSSLQFDNARNAQFIYPEKIDTAGLKGYLGAIRAVTGNSDKVYFVDRFDFALYYYGGYAPVGYCSPFSTWIFNSDLNRFLQGLLDQGYYLACSSDLRYLLSQMRYDKIEMISGFAVVSKHVARAVKP